MQAGPETEVAEETVVVVSGCVKKQP